MTDRAAASRPRTILVLLAACGLAVSALAVVPGPARAQSEEATAPSRTRVGLALEVAEPVGEFDRFVDTSWGIGLSLAHDLTSDGVVGLRVEGGWSRYGNVSRRVPFSLTARSVFLDLDVNNQMGRLTAGPQLTLPLGPVRPFVHAGVGFTYLTTRSTLESTDRRDRLGDRRRDGRELASTTHFSELTPALAAGGGLSVRVSGGEHPVGLLLSASYVRNGTAEYVLNQDLDRLAEGERDVTPIRSEADLVALRAGVEIGL
mgnify:CR=1 FL=1